MVSEPQPQQAAPAAPHTVLLIFCLDVLFALSDHLGPRPNMGTFPVRLPLLPSIIMRAIKTVPGHAEISPEMRQRVVSWYGTDQNADSNTNALFQIDVSGKNADWQAAPAAAAQPAGKTRTKYIPAPGHRTL